jgi:hypothetical protein
LALLRAEKLLLTATLTFLLRRRTRLPTRHDLFIMAAEVEDALGRRIDFLIRSDVEAMKDVKAKNLILKNAVTVYVP